VSQGKKGGKVSFTVESFISRLPLANTQAKVEEEGREGGGPAKVIKDALVFLERREGGGGFEKERGREEAPSAKR